MNTDVVHDQAIVALAEEKNLQDAADRVGISDRTLRNWLQNPDFQGKLRQTRKAALGQAIDKASARLSQGTDVLWEIVNDPDSSATARINAFNSMKDLALRGMDLDDLVERVEALEAQLPQGDSNGWDD